MQKICPHCGALLLHVGDAFCSECREPISSQLENTVNPIASFTKRTHDTGLLAEHLTLPARILIVVSLVLAFGGPWAVFVWLRDSLPPDRYPLWFFALPIWVAVALLFGLATIAFKRLGIPVYRQSSQLDDAAAPGAVNNPNRRSSDRRN